VIVTGNDRERFDDIMKQVSRRRLTSGVGLDLTWIDLLVLTGSACILVLY